MHLKTALARLLADERGDEELPVRWLSFAILIGLAIVTCIAAFGF